MVGLVRGYGVWGKQIHLNKEVVKRMKGTIIMNNYDEGYPDMSDSCRYHIVEGRGE